MIRGDDSEYSVTVYEKNKDLNIAILRMIVMGMLPAAGASSRSGPASF